MTSERKKVKQADPEAMRQTVADLIKNFEAELRSGELRSKVLALVPIFYGLRDLGKALIPAEYASAARDRILYFFREYPGTIINGDELLVVSGIQEYAHNQQRSPWDTIHPGRPWAYKLQLPSNDEYKIKEETAEYIAQTKSKMAQQKNPAAAQLGVGNLSEGEVSVFALAK